MAFLEVARASGITAWKSSNSYAEAERAIARYLAALSLSDKAALARLRDPVWSRRKLNGGDKLHFAGDAVPIASVQEPLDWANGVWLTSLQIFRDGLAVARLDDWDHDKAAIMLLFFVDGKWRVASEISVTAEHGDNRAGMQLETAEQDVLAVLARFYDAVEQRSVAALRDLSDENWHVKRHSPMQHVVAEDMAGFIDRIDIAPPRLHRDNCKVADVQILFNRLACVRIDTPRLAQTTIFLLCRRGPDWVIAEKASSGGMAEQVPHRMAM
ncbi:MAG: hypothetical protein ACTS1X_10200 [Parasphingopyxis sp.]|uniref:hypothetical protein n=1 Tax=Parasphingopyxis sp. TaxID=1920299 RepID=UPI003F9F805B